MSWQAFQLVFRLESPLHIGWRKIGNLMQTRYYVPGRVLWGAVTANLTRWLGNTDYIQTGEWVKENLRFGYFFPAEEPNDPLYPVQFAGRVIYGKDGMDSAKFERRFLSSMASTAIISHTNTAEEGSLHEVEFIKPSLAIGKPVYLIGHLLVHQNKMIDIRDNDVVIRDLSLFSQVITSLQIGGERRYGFGRLTLCQDKCRQVRDIFGYPLNQQRNQCNVSVPAQHPLLAHTIVDSFMNGSIEPLISREWKRQSGPGRQIALLGLYYLPGTVVTSDMTLTIERYGTWKQNNFV